MNKKQYNEEPVLFCKHCLSLNIQDVLNNTSDEIKILGTEYCSNCSSASIGIATLEHWKELYKEKYHRNYINYGRKY